MRLNEIWNHHPEGFSGFYYHGSSNSEIKLGQMYPPNKNLIFLAMDYEDAYQYGSQVYKIKVKDNIKSIDLCDRYSKSTIDVLEKIKQDLKNKKIVDMITGGKLWRNKPLERKVINWLIKNGYKRIIISDEMGEDGGETTSMIVVNPHENCYVLDIARN